MAGGRTARGVGGWLLLLVIVIGVLVPLVQAGSVWMLIRSEPLLQRFYGSGWPAFRAMLLIIIAARAVLSAFIAWRLVYRQQPSTRRIAIIGMWLVFGVLNVLSLAVGFVYTPHAYPVGQAMWRLAWPLLLCAIATGYLLKSKRVANTYRPQDELHAVFE
jgi:Protein of unknown function (DUF2569)